MDVGLLFTADNLSASEMGGFARAIEAGGLAALWVPELFGRDPFVCAGVLLSATERLRVGTGIANVYARDAVAARTAADTLADLYGERFELGLGVSNPQVNAVRGHAWLPPLDKLSAYFEAMDEAPLGFRAPRAPVYLAAHGPRLLTFAAARADGANVYLMTRAYVRHARTLLGTGKRINLLLHAFHCTDAGRARGRARKAIAMYQSLPNYHRAWRAMGFRDADFALPPSDAFIDELFAWGDVDELRARFAEYASAGVDRVVVIPHNFAADGRPDLELLAALAG